MESATKALIIVGAVLLSILIIGLGIFVYNQASNSVGDTGLDKLEIQQFNAQFETYLDKKMGASLAKSLINAVNQSNSSGKNHVELAGLTKDQLVVGDDYIAKAERNDKLYITKITISAYEEE